MNDINAAMTSISRVNPRYNDEVKSSYSAQNSGSSLLTGVERSWLKANGNTITLGYLKNQLPYCTQNDDGEMEGSLASLATTLHDKFDITVKTVAFSSNKQMTKALSKGTIDVALPLFRDYWLAEQGGTIQSNPMGTVSLTAIHSSNNLDSDLKSIACTEGAIVNRFELESLFPDATVTEYPNADEALKALNKGTASCIIVPSTRLQTIRDAHDIEDFETQELTNTAQLSCLISRGKSELLGIINKGIINAGESLSASSYSPASYSAQESDTFRFIYRNRIAVATVIIFILLAGIVVLIWSLQRAQQERQKADAANAAKTAFLTRMSHDIRTPLNGMLGLIEIEELKEGDMQVARESRAKARVAANHLLSLINDILEMGRIEECKVTLEHESFNLKELCDDALVLCKLRASDRGITMLDTSEPYAVDQYMIGSPTHIRQILVNLLDNSIKYNKRGGTVTFSSTVKPLDDEHAMFCFSVSDTGIGMSEEFQQHLYEPFSREEQQVEGASSGTGLGASIAKQLVELMGGTMSFTSALGQGTTFTICLPFEKCKSSEIPQAVRVDAGDSDVLQGLRVLLVEDNDLNAEIAQFTLDRAGAVVTHVKDGESAVETFAASALHEYDVVLMDIMMPGIDGLEATRQIRALDREDAATTPIIAVSANAFADDRRLSREAGMNAHLSKPVSSQDLVEALAHIAADAS